MTLRHLALVGAVGVLLGATGTTLDAQTLGAPAFRPALDGTYTQLRFDADGRDVVAHGVGARLMFSPTAGTRFASGILGRTDVGLYATYAADRDFTGPGVNLSTFTLGVAADVRPFPAPILGRVEPFVSLGTGMLRTNVDDGPLAQAPSPILDRSRTVFTVTPGVGTRLYLTPTLALQGDVRDVVTFRGDTRHNVALGLGLRFGL